MGNYDQMLALGRRLFLEWDQEKMIARRDLECDEKYLYISFLGQRHRIDRATAVVENLALGRETDHLPPLCIFDYLCRDNFQPGISGSLRAAVNLKHAAQSSPNAADLYQPHADRLQAHFPALKQALRDLGRPFPQGDAACVADVFPGFPLVFQFWEGDEEFPPSVRFLWDENALYYLRFETLHYVMHCFLDLLNARIAEIEKNVK